jgi:superfamily II DNA or RNA helicase
MNYSTFELRGQDSSTMESICKPTSFTLQTHQQFLKKYTKDQAKSLRLLLFHGLGSGKTCSSISITEQFKTLRRKILYVVPASLINNIYKELYSECGKYLSKKDLDMLSEEGSACSESKVNAKKKIILKAKSKIHKYYDIISYQKFTNLSSQNKLDLNNTTIVIDEVQNIISSSGSTYQIFLRELFHKKPKNVRLILLSGTPMFDKPDELALIGNLLVDPHENNNTLLPTASAFYKKFMNKDDTLKNKDVLFRFFQNRVSYFRGANPVAYPKKDEYIVECPMSKFQYKVYQKAIGAKTMHVDDTNIKQTFLIGPRQASNVVYPKGSVGVTERPSDAVLLRSLNTKKHAIKFDHAITRINKSPGSTFVYSNFVSSGGVNDFTIALKQHDYTEIATNTCPSKTGKRFAVFRTGKSEENIRILSIFNSKENKDGSLIKIIIGSPAMKEGITLLRVQSVHLLDPYWNKSRVSQIIGRAIRFCSHKDVPVSKRIVKVYHYIAVSPSSEYKLRKVTKKFFIKNAWQNDDVMVDTYIRVMSQTKQKLIGLFENVLKSIAIDCTLFKAGNEDDIVCHKPLAVVDEHVNHQASIPGIFVKKKIKKKGSSSEEKIFKRKKLKFTRNKDVTKQRAVNRGPQDDSIKGCPLNRRPTRLGECPISFPNKRKNKFGNDCCYKYKTTKPPQVVNKHKLHIHNNKFMIGRKTCKTYTKPQIQALFKLFRLAPIKGTKAVLCKHLSDMRL